MGASGWRERGRRRSKKRRAMEKWRIPVPTVARTSMTKRRISVDWLVHLRRGLALCVFHLFCLPRWKKSDRGVSFNHSLSLCIYLTSARCLCVRVCVSWNSLLASITLVARCYEDLLTCLAWKYTASTWGRREEKKWAWEQTCATRRSNVSGNT